LSCLSSDEHRDPGRQNEPYVSLSLVAVNQSAINMRPMVSIGATAHDDGDGGGAQLLTVPRPRFLTVDDMKQAVSIETLASDEDDHCL